jgi:TolA-binding protein
LPLSEEALRAARALAGPSSKTAPFREPGVFREDIERTSSGGESSRLSQIVQGPFSSRKWGEAGEELRRFLSLPRSAVVESRSRFYLGQVYYFTGKPREALFEFLSARNMYPNETNPWIDAVLARLVN